MVTASQEAGLQVDWLADCVHVVGGSSHVLAGSETISVGVVIRVQLYPVRAVYETWQLVVAGLLHVPQLSLHETLCTVPGFGTVFVIVP